MFLYYTLFIFYFKIKTKKPAFTGFGRSLTKELFCCNRWVELTHPPVREEENMTMPLSDNYDYQPFQNLKL